MWKLFLGAVGLGTVLGGIIGWLTYTEEDEPIEQRESSGAADVFGAGRWGLCALPWGPNR